MKKVQKKSISKLKVLSKNEMNKVKGGILTTPIKSNIIVVTCW